MESGHSTNEEGTRKVADASLQINAVVLRPSSSPRPFTAVDNTVAVAIVLGPSRRAPIFLVAQITVTVGVESLVARFPGRAIVRLVKTAAIPAIRVFGPADSAVPIGVPVRVAGRSIIVPFSGRDSTVSIGVDDDRTAGGVGAVGIERLRNRRNVTGDAADCIATGK